MSDTQDCASRASTSKTRGYGILPFLVGACLFAAAPFHLDIITGFGYFCTSIGIWQYQESPLFLAYLKNEWSKLSEIPPMPFAEIHADNFTKELFWELTNDLRRPLVIRGALANSEAVHKWGKEYFVDNFPDTLILVREMLDDTSFRFVRATMADFWDAYSHAANVSIVASSGIFVREPALKAQVTTYFENDVVDKAGNGLFVSQLFVTPGGRTFFHTEFGGNFFRQIAGRKKWTVIAPEYTKYLCPHFIRGSATVRPCVQSFDLELRENWFKRIPRMETVLEPGDIIYNAPWFWHDVQSEGAETTQASVAGRIRNVHTSFSLAPVLSFGVLADKTISKFSGDYVEYPVSDDEMLPIKLENLLVESWTSNCLAQGHDNCYGLTKYT